MLSRLRTVAPYTRWVRLPRSGQGLQRAPSLAKSPDLGLRVACGTSLSSNASANDAELAALISLAQAGACDVVVVGSETLERGDLTAAALLAYVQRVRDMAPGPLVTTADTHRALLANRSVLQDVDVVYVNYHPYREGVAIDRAVTTVDTWHLELRAAVGDKPIVVSETGWPSCGAPIGAAVPSESNERWYALGILEWARSRRVDLFYFGAFDEPWRTTEGQYAACWGVWDSGGLIKPAMRSVLGAP